MDKRNVLNRIIVTLVTAIIVSAMVAHTGMVWVAIISGVVASMAVALGWLKVTSSTEFVRDLLSAIVGAQCGWVALLI